MKRVVITGIGVTSPIGIGRESFFDALSKGKSGINRISVFDAESFSVKIAGEVKGLKIEPFIDKFPQIKEIRDRKVYLGLVAVEEAISDALLSEEELSNDSCGINLGTCMEILTLEDLVFKVTDGKIDLEILKEELPKSPKKLQTPLDTLNRLIANRYKIVGPSFINCSACAASAQAIGHSYTKIKRGEANIFICGGFDSLINPLCIGGFDLLGALSRRNELLGKACCPFDIKRDGAVLGEGAGIIVLEELSHAMKRKAKIYAEIVGFGSSLDAYRPTDPDPEGEGAARAMRMAIDDAQIKPTDIDYINAHGTSTPKNDVVETQAIKTVFGKKAYKIPVSSTKSMIGHLIAAAGSVELIASLLGFERNLIPPTINLETPDPFCDLDYVPNFARKWEGKYILTNSFGFGGQNACLILKRYEVER
jgi:3-oxoacyl-[acyl-carrier-protein] synthase II